MKKLLTTAVRYLKGIGPKRAKLLEKLSLFTAEDVLYYFPRRYEDRREFVPIAKLEEGRNQTIKAEVLSSRSHYSYSRRGFSLTEIAVRDKSGKVRCVWFNQPYLKDYFKCGLTLILYGKPQRYQGKLQLNSPEFEIISETADESLNVGRIVPSYSLPAGMTQRYFRRVIKEALDNYIGSVYDFLPFDIRNRNNLLNLAKSLINIHFPDDPVAQKEAHRRLSFEEFFLFQMLLALRRARKKESSGIIHRIKGGLVEAFLKALPFELTGGQLKALEEIKSDMSSNKAMQRLLQGEVGSGKTVVAVICALCAIQGGYQAVFMVPTEILARQHFQNIGYQVLGIRYRGKQIRIGLLTGSLDKKQKEKVYREIKTGEIDLVIGTHALLEEGVDFKGLGLVVIDEQHRFGVGQRALLNQKARQPDTLIMTATPIPRTLAITLYGDLDISVINELPPGRLPVQTLYFRSNERDRAYEVAKRQLK
ncbi:MAG: ATP-dependent DNA helicase RecG, partial [Candidatus Omnitrophica bacterium]|nr:ATP-dependent DNA helicase RecG [Candidatus Omnitrophota bacterium]